MRTNSKFGFPSSSNSRNFPIQLKTKDKKIKENIPNSYQELNHLIISLPQFLPYA